MKWSQLSALTLIALASETQAFGRSRGRGRSRNWSSSSSTTTTTTTQSWETTEEVTGTVTTSSGRQRNRVSTARGDSNDPDHLLLCEGYVASMYGDPHLTTFDGSHTYCQNEGEFVLLKSGSSLQIQARLELLSSGTASVTKAVAVDMDGTDKIQVGFAEYDSGSSTTIDIKTECPIHLYINDVLTAASVGSVISGDGYELSVTSTSIEIQYEDGSGNPTAAVEIQPSGSRNCMFTSYYCLPSADEDLLTSTVGLLGTPNNDLGDEYMDTNGEYMDEPTSDTERFSYCSTQHCVFSEEQSIMFHETANGGQSFAQLENCEGTFQGSPDISDPDPEIEELCGDNVECLTDAIVLGPDDARTTLEVQDNTVAIHISTTVVDITPTVDTSCPGDIEFLQIDGDAPFDQIPFTIVEQTSDGVTLAIRTASFGGVAKMYVEYEEDYVQKCISEQDVTTAYTEEIHVSCVGTEKVALVNVVASDPLLTEGLDTAEAAQCCHADSDTNPKVKYTFLVSCESKCPPVAARSLRGN